MNKEQYLTSLRENIDQFRASASLGLEPSVPGCPEWTVGQLVVHLGDVYEFWSHIVETPIKDQDGFKAFLANLQAERSARESADFHGSPKALEYFNEHADHIQRVLEAADPDQPNWTWWPPNQTAGFVQRRMAHETTIHRWDAQSAHGVQTPIVPAGVASDGIDEAVKNELTGWPPEDKTFPNASFHLHCTDVDGEWIIEASGATVEVRNDHEKADLAITGPASDILLFIWGRVPATQLTLHGNQALVEKFTSLFDME